MIGIYVYTRGVCGVCFAFRSVQLELLNGFLLYFFFIELLHNYNNQMRLLLVCAQPAVNCIYI